MPFVVTVLIGDVVPMGEFDTFIARGTRTDILL